MKKNIINKKRLLIILSIIIGGVIILFIAQIGLVIGMQKGPESIQLPKELDSLESDIKKKYDIDSYGVMNSGPLTSYISVKEIENCEHKQQFYVNISPIENKKYFDENLMIKEADSLYPLINKYLPYKDCIDSIYIYLFAFDTISDNYVYEKVLKYPVTE